MLSDKPVNFCDIDKSHIIEEAAEKLKLRSGKMVNPAFTAIQTSEDLMLHLDKLKAMLAASPHDGFLKGYKSYRQALMSPDSVKWRTAYADELKKLEEIGGLLVVKRPKGVKLLPFLEVLTQKLDNVTHKLKTKVRLAARGDLFETDNNTYSPVPSSTQQRMFIAFAVGKQYEIRQGDISSAYLNAKFSEPVYFYLPSGHPQFQDKT